MNITKFALTNLVAAGLGLCMATAANSADVSKVFDSYSSNSGGTYSTSNGNYWHGGSFQGRIVQPNVQVAGFTPPSLSGSCSGIDIFAGSFSLISGDELVQVARGIAQGAAPYFFGLAMKSICPACEEVMSELKGITNDLNRFGQNSCTQAMEMVDSQFDISGTMNSWGQGEGSLNDSMQGFSDDYLAKARDYIKGPGYTGVNAVTSALRDSQSVNVIYELLNENASSLQMPALDLSGDELIGFIISLTGTLIIQNSEPDCDTRKANGKLCIDVSSKPSVLSFDTIFYGHETGDNMGDIYTCTGVDKCLNIGNGSTYDQQGLLELYTDIILGSDSEEGLLTTYEKKDNLSAKQVSLLTATRFPFHMVAAKMKGTQKTEVGSAIASRLARNQTIELGNQIRKLLRDARASLSGKTNSSKFQDEVDNLIAVLDDGLNAFEKKSENSLKGTEDVAKLLLTFKQLN